MIILEESEFYICTRIERTVGAHHVQYTRYVATIIRKHRKLWIDFYDDDITKLMI